MINNLNVLFKNSFFTFLSIFFSASLAAQVKQEVTPNILFKNHMVLQQNVLVPVWGTANVGEKITVTFANQQKTTITNNDGKWALKLTPLKASKVGQKMTISGNKTIVINDVLVGEVWICSGQSNMAMGVKADPNLIPLLEEAKNIRSFEVQRTVSLKEEENGVGNWKVNTANSAVAFGFAYFLEKAAEVPVGIIHTSWGSSSIEAWMPKDMVKELPYFKKIMQNFDTDTITIDKLENIIAKKNKRTRKEDIFIRRQPNILYNAMMKPLIPFACKGLLWYQGERNTRYFSGMPVFEKERWFHQVVGMKEYGSVLKKWIERYRKEWKNKDMHFIIVMLPGYGKGTHNKININPESPTEKSWAWMRESQLKALELENTSVVNTIDLGDVKNIHPKDKLPVGKRAALLAEKYTLNKATIALGPMPKKVVHKNDKLIVHFKNVKKLKTTNKKSPTGFWVANEERIWKKAKAKIKGKKVILTTPEIEKPVYIRYAFAAKSTVNLVNENNLPAYPFRTDSFETP